MSIFVASMLTIIAQTSTPQKYTLRFEEKVMPGNATFENQKLPAKANRVSSKKGDIQIVYFDEFPDSMKVAISAAVDLWESKISNKLPIYIGVLFYPLDSDVAVAADVSYYMASENSENLSGCPTALATQIAGYLDSDENSPDGFIYFNPNIDWDCSFKGDMRNLYNLTTMASRGIARCLGFGSSIFEIEEEGYFFSARIPTYFDKLLRCDSTYLLDLTDNSPEMATFVKSDNVYLTTPSNTYKVYAPTIYKPDMSLNYFDEDDSLMSYSLGQGNSVLTIDNKTLDVLRTIGWDLPETNLSIKCSDIGDDGIGSSYKSHEFYLDTSETISDYQWKFYLKNKSEEFVEVSNGVSARFSIAKIDSTDNYFVNVNGDLEGKIECNYTIDGISYSATPFSVSLELKPIIHSINDLNIIKQDNYSFYLTFTVNYTGADYLYLEVEEEYDSVLRSDRIDEPYLAHIKTGNISTLYYSWVTIEVSNQYGSTYQTLEFEPDLGTYRLINQEKEVANISATIENNILKTQIYNLNGVMIFNGLPSDFNKHNLSSGLYLRKDLFESGEFNISKFIVL